MKIFKMGDFSDSRFELDCDTLGDFTYQLFSDMTVSIKKISTSETVNINPDNKVASKVTLRLLSGLEKNDITEMYKLSQNLVATYATTMITKKIEGLCTEVDTLTAGITAVQTHLVTIDAKMNDITGYIEGTAAREAALLASIKAENATLLASIKADADVREAKSAAKSAAQAKERLAAETASHAIAQASTKRDFYLSRQIAELSTRVGNVKGDCNPRRDDRPAWEKAKFPCRFINRPGGCRSGTNCPYSHDVAE